MARWRCARCRDGIPHNFQHGVNVTGFNCHGCRCEACKAAKALYNASARATPQARRRERERQRLRRLDNPTLNMPSTPEARARKNEKNRQYAAQRSKEEQAAARTRTKEKNQRVPVTRQGAYSPAEDAIIRKALSNLEKAYILHRSVASVVDRKSALQVHDRARCLVDELMEAAGAA